MIGATYLLRFAPLAAVVGASLGIVTSAAAQAQKFPCQAFRLEPNGTLSVLQPMSIKTANGEVQFSPGTSLHPKDQFIGIDLYAVYRQHCR